MAANALQNGMHEVAVRPWQNGASLLHLVPLKVPVVAFVCLRRHDGTHCLLTTSQ